MLVGILLALAGWSLSRTFELSTIQAVHEDKVQRIQTTEKAIQALIIGLALVLVLLVGCSYKMVPHETKIEYGTTETDSKNNKLQQKQSITQTWKWKQQ